MYDDLVNGNVWFFDVDLFLNGNLFVLLLCGIDIVVFEFDLDICECVWEQCFDMEDIYDVDVFGEDEFFIVNMCEWNDFVGVSED